MWSKSLKICVLLALNLIFNTALSQSNGAGLCLVDVQVKDVCAYSDQDAFSSDELVWLVSANNVTQCININLDPRCFLGVNRQILNDAPIQYNFPIPLKLDAWENDAGSECIYNESDWWDNGGDGDDNRCTLNFGPVVVTDYAPGEIFEVNKSCNNQYSVRLEFIYSPPIPNQPSVKINGVDYQFGVACSDQTITLLTKDYIKTNDVPNGFIKPEFAAKVNLVWEYQFNGESTTIEIPNPAYCGDDPSCAGGDGPKINIKKEAANSYTITPPCCLEPATIPLEQPVWRPLGTTNLSDNQGNLAFILNTLPAMQSLAAVGKLNIRVKAVAGNLSSAYSQTRQIDIAPQTPKATAISVTPSCTNASTGVITISGITAPINNFRVIAYRIEDGINAPGYFSTYSGSMPATLSVSNLPTGTYRIELSYASIACSTEYTNLITSTLPILIGTYPPRTLSASIAQHVSCQGYQDGIIRVSSAGGNGSSAVTYTITPAAGIFAADKNEFQNLPAGTYTLRVNDGCVAPVQLTSSITITQPTRVVGNFTISHPTCLASPDGMLSLSGMSGGSGLYNYQLKQAGNVIRSQMQSAATMWLVNDLPGGTYQIDVTDAARPSCPGYQPAVFTLTPVTPLSMTYTASPITCFGANDGRIQLQASGGSGSYLYKLINTSTSEVIQGGSNPLFTSLKKGNYTAYLTNSSACTDQAVVSNILVNEPDDISFSFTVSQIKCAGEENGKIVAVVAGGNGGYSLQWQFNEGNGWTNYTFAGGQTLVIDKLFPAQYRLRVTDVKNCVQTSAAVTLVDPPALELTQVAFTHVTCLNANDGTITPSAQGGWGNYAYEYSSNGGTLYSTLLPGTKLPAGSYLVHVRDQQGCVAEYAQTITITQPATQIAVTYTYSDYSGYAVSCSGASDGQITIRASGGNGAPFTNGSYTYSIDDSSYATNAIITGLTEGIHQVRVKDARGCIYKEQITLSAPSPLAVSLLTKNYIKCFGDNTGIIEVSVAGGVSPYQFKLDQNSYQSSARFINLPGGNHLITVKDKNQCTSEFQTNIESPNAAITFAIAKSDVQCFGQANGSIQVTVQGGVSPYRYVWANRAETGNQLTNLAPDDYTLDITDQENCSKQTTVTIRQPDAALTVSARVVPVQCHGESNGSVELIVVGGTPPYSYSKDGGNTFQSAPLFTNLSPGTFSFISKDANACSALITATVLDPPTFIVQLASKTDIRCFGESTGEIRVSASGGVAPYQYSLDGLFFQSSPILSALPAGTKVISVKDQYGCIRQLTVTLTQPLAPLSMTYSVTNVKCKGEANGKIVVVPQGGTLPYSYAWIGRPEKTSELTNIPAGSYSVIVQDANGCSLERTISVIEPAQALTIEATAKMDVSCFGASDGRFRMFAQGGYPPYQYSFQGSTYSTNDTYQSLTPQFYSIAVRDAMGCLAIGSVTISEPTPLTLSVFNQKEVSCSAGSDGFIDLLATGGTAPYSYSKDGGQTFVSNALFNQLRAGVFNLVVRDARLCQTTLSITLTEPLVLQSVIRNVVNSACGQANGSASVIAQGGTAPYGYQWKNAQGTMVSVLPSPTDLLSGFYTVIVTDVHDCVTTNSVTINDDGGPSAVISSVTDASCFGFSDGQATVTASGGAGGYSYLWSDGQQSVTAKNLKRGTYVVTVTDQRGCKTLATAVVGSPVAIAYTLVGSVNPSCYESCDGVVEMNAKDGVSPYTYQWLGGETAINGKATQLCRGDHVVKVTGADGCTSQFAFTLTAPEPLQINLVTLKMPSCAGFCDGEMNVQATGGTAPYRFEWTGHSDWNTSIVKNLCAGTYEVSVKDANNCVALRQIVVEEAPPLSIELGPDVTLCDQQVLVLDAGVSNATYEWRKNAGMWSDQRTVQISDAGEYEVTVRTATGCTATDKIRVTKSATAFSANFLGASELVLSDTLLLTEVCFPKPDEVRWTLDPGLTTIGQKEDQPMVKATQEGKYKVHLRAQYKECTDQVSKEITFFKDEDKGKIGGRLKLGNEGIKQVSTFPNPTTGAVQINVQLYSEQTVAMFLYSMDGLEIGRSRKAGRQAYDFEFDISGYPPGVYIARVATDYQQKDVRIVLLK